MRRRKYQGQCPLCGQTANLSKEDVFPTWLRNEYVERHLEELVRPSRVILRVCVGCNNAMAEAFEHHAAPILKRFMWTGEPATLSEVEQTVLARWLIKTDALLAVYRGKAEHTKQFGLSAHDEEEMLEMVRQMTADHQFVPANAIVRIGLVDTNLLLSSMRQFRPMGALSAVGSGWFDSVMATGLVLSQTDLFTDRGGDVKEYLRQATDRRFVTLTPSQGGPVTVPVRLDVRSIYRLRRELGHVPSNVVGDGWAALV